MSVRYCGDEFKNLNTWDQLSLDNVMKRYVNTIKSFDAYDDKFGQCFIYIDDRARKVPEVMELHKKYNSKYYDIDNNPDHKVCFWPYGHSPYKDIETYDDNFKIGGDPNVQFRDGSIRSGTASLPWPGYIHHLKLGDYSDKFLYFLIPKELINDYMVKTTNRVDITIARKFANIVESSIGWDDVESIKSLIIEFDKKYQHWNHDFPIFRYSHIKKYGLIFPVFRLSPWNIIANGSHRLMMTALSNSDIPFIVPVPTGGCVGEDNEYANRWVGLSTEKIFKDDTQLWIEINRKERNINFYLTDEYNIQSNRKKTIGWGESMINLFERTNKEIIKL
tara:strand:- start:399 stop:1400 length:1002 start_codon:yes stop_codon:yes gene_type:complete